MTWLALNAMQTYFAPRTAICALALLTTFACADAAPEAPMEVAPNAPQPVVWTFDNLSQIGGHPVEVLGDPQIVDTPLGKGVQFDGVDDALVLDVHPLAGAETFTWEAIFRPDGGAEEQRWFHLNENPATGQPTQNRMLFEVRIVGGQWCLDTFIQSSAGSATLIDRSHLYPLGRWYRVAAVYDGRELRSYVNTDLDGVAEMAFQPQAAGRTSVGVRINKVNYFQGAVHSARFTRRALAPDELLAAPTAD